MRDDGTAGAAQYEEAYAGSGMTRGGQNVMSQPRKMNQRETYNQAGPNQYDPQQF